MVVYAFAHITKELRPLVFQRFLQQLPPAMQQKTLRFRRWQDQNNSLFGKVLLRHLLIRHFQQAQDCLDQLYANQYGKLFLNAQLDFNISHSDRLVICMISDEGAIGVDVEKRRPFKVEDIQTFLRPEEYAQLQNDPTSERFYDFWTKKEAILKAKGLGLNLDLRNVHLHGQRGHLLPPLDEWWHFYPLTLHPDYTTTFCLQTPQATPQQIELSALSSSFSLLHF
ncbi:MAG: 4'-phosphopantetheinyl transferase superfamily protein [Bacteroidota bacterium]